MMHTQNTNEMSTSHQERPSSSITRIVREDGQAVYAKRYVEGDWGRTAEVVHRRTRREIDLVERLRASGEFGRRLGVMRIIESEPSAGRLTVAEVPGRSLDELVGTEFRKANADCCRAMWLAGRWLRKLQQIPLNESDRAPIGSLDPTELRDYCRLRLETLVEYGYRAMNKRLITRLLDRVQQLEDQSERADREYVWSHADYAPGNLIWDGSCLTPIDFGMAQADRPLQDVTYLVHRLEMLQIYRPWKKWPLSRWRRSFLNGYRRPEAAKSPMYAALMIRHLICRLHTYCRRPPRDLKQQLHDRWVRCVLQNKLERAADGK